MLQSVIPTLNIHVMKKIVRFCMTSRSFGVSPTVISNSICTDFVKRFTRFSIVRHQCLHLLTAVCIVTAFLLLSRNVNDLYRLNVLNLFVFYFYRDCTFIVLHKNESVLRIINCSKVVIIPKSSILDCLMISSLNSSSSRDQGCLNFHLTIS